MYKRQDTYLQTLIVAKQVNRRTGKKSGNIPEEGNQSEELGLNEHDDSQTAYKRNNTYQYQIKIDGDLKCVCRNLFLKVHGVSADRIKRLCALLLLNECQKGQEQKWKCHTRRHLCSGCLLYTSRCV